MRSRIAAKKSGQGRSSNTSRHSHRVDQLAIIHTVNLSTIQSLIRSLESDPQQIPACYMKLEESIAWFMDRTFESKDGAEKVRLAATELRARGVLECYRKGNVN